MIRGLEFDNHTMVSTITISNDGDSLYIKLELNDNVRDERFDLVELYEHCKEHPFWFANRIVTHDKLLIKYNKKLEKAK